MYKPAMFSSRSIPRNYWVQKAKWTQRKREGGIHPKLKYFLHFKHRILQHPFAISLG